MSEDIKCPICGNDYCGDKCWESKKDLAILANALRKQLIELQSDKVEIISQRDTWIGNADALRKQLEGEIEIVMHLRHDIKLQAGMLCDLRVRLDVAMTALERLAAGDYRQTTSKVYWQVAQDTLAEIEEVNDGD